MAFQSLSVVGEQADFLQHEILKLSCHGHLVACSESIITVLAVCKDIRSELRVHPKSAQSMPVWPSHDRAWAMEPDENVKIYEAIVNHWCAEYSNSHSLTQVLRANVIRKLRELQDVIIDCVSDFYYVFCAHHLCIWGVLFAEMSNYLREHCLSVIACHTFQAEVGNKEFVTVSWHERTMFNEWKYDTRRFDAEFKDFHAATYLH